MYNRTPFFSVIIPVYNRRDFLPIAIESVLKQTFSGYELIIVDDGSTDGTTKLLRSDLSRIKSLIYMYQKHQGISSARNYGIKNANGNFIAFLDSDDRFCRQKLQIAYEHIQNNPGYKIFHTNEIWYKNGKLLPQKAYQKKPTGFVFKQVLKLCCISSSTVVIKKDLFKDIGLFDKNFPVCEDYDLWLRAASKHPICLISRALTIKEGGHLDQQSIKYPALDKFRIDAIHKLIVSNNLTKKQYSLACDEFKNKCCIYIQGALKRGKKIEASYYLNLCKNLGNNNA